MLSLEVGIWHFSTAGHQWEPYVAFGDSMWKRLNTPKRKHQQPAPLLPLKLPVRSSGFCERSQSTASRGSRAYVAVSRPLACTCARARACSENLELFLGEHIQVASAKSLKPRPSGVLRVSLHTHQVSKYCSRTLAGFWLLIFYQTDGQIEIPYSCFNSFENQ